MKRFYRNVFHRPVEGVAPGKEGELDLTAEQEAEYLYWKRLEIVPVEYLVVGPRRVSGCEPGETFTAAFPQPLEAMLVESGHIEAAKPKRAKPSDRSD